MRLGYGRGDSRDAVRELTQRQEPERVDTDIPVELDVPRDPNSTFEPQIVPEGSAAASWVERAHPRLYGRRMTVRDIEAHLEEMYDVEVSPTGSRRSPPRCWRRRRG